MRCSIADSSVFMALERRCRRHEGSLTRRPRTPAPPRAQATALAHPTRKATAYAAALRFDLARGSLGARFGRRAAAPLSAPREEAND